MYLKKYILFGESLHMLMEHLQEYHFSETQCIIINNHEILQN